MCALYSVIIQYDKDEVILEISCRFPRIFWVLTRLLDDTAWESIEITRRGKKEIQEEEEENPAKEHEQ